MRLNKLGIAMCCALFIGGCQSSSHLVEFKNADEASNLSTGEKRLWSQSDDAVTVIRRSGKLLLDQDAELHINQMAQALFPEFKDEIKIEIIKSPILNAFAFPNGRLFIHSGIIAAAQNDSQLAAVVAHEVAHFTKRHSAKNRISAANTTSFIVFMNVMGIPLLGEFIGLSSIAGFSRDLEREADLEAIKRMGSAGYDISQAKHIFEFMASDAIANEYDAPWFFASHPDLLERIENFNQYEKSFGNAYVPNPVFQDNDRYESIFANVRSVALKEKLEIGHYSSLINEYEQHYTDSVYYDNSDELFYFANAYRLRNKPDDMDNAYRIFAAYFERHQDNPKAYMHAGVVCMELNKLSCAKEHLEKANQLSEGSNGYVKMYLKKLEVKESTNEL